VDEESAPEIGLALDGDRGAGFDMLGEELGEDDLLGEKFGADGDLGLGRLVAGGREVKEVEEKKKVEEAERGTIHGSREFLTREKKEKEEYNAETQSAQRKHREESFVRRL
jgi:hypothetical protein